MKLDLEKFNKDISKQRMSDKEKKRSASVKLLTTENNNGSTAS